MTITTKQPFLSLFGWIKLNAEVDKFNFVSYFCIRKSYPNKQSDADHGKLDDCHPYHYQSATVIPIFLIKKQAFMFWATPSRKRYEKASSLSRISASKQ